MTTPPPTSGRGDRSTCLWRHTWSPRFHGFGFVNLSSDAEKARPSCEECSFGRSHLQLELSSRPFHHPNGQQTIRTLPLSLRSHILPLVVHILTSINPYHNLLPCPPYTTIPVEDKRPSAKLRGGTLLHNGFCDLLALILTPLSRFILGGDC